MTLPAEREVILIFKKLRDVKLIVRTSVTEYKSSVTNKDC